MTAACGFSTSTTTSAVTTGGVIITVYLMTPDPNANAALALYLQENAAQVRQDAALGGGPTAAALASASWPGLRVFKGRLPFIVFLGTRRSWTPTLIPSNLTWHSIDTWIRSMFELTQLRCFTTVATELNFRRAAERLNMTQPPLSRQIQLLEHHLGVELFTRSTREDSSTQAPSSGVPTVVVSPLDAPAKLFARLASSW